MASANISKKRKVRILSTSTHTAVTLSPKRLFVMRPTQPLQYDSSTICPNVPTCEHDDKYILPTIRWMLQTYRCKTRRALQWLDDSKFQLSLMDPIGRYHIQSASSLSTHFTSQTVTAEDGPTTSAFLIAGLASEHDTERPNDLAQSLGPQSNCLMQWSKLSISLPTPACMTKR